MRMSEQEQKIFSMLIIFYKYYNNKELNDKNLLNERISVRTSTKLFAAM